MRQSLLLVFCLILSGCVPTRRDITMFAFSPIQQSQNLPLPLLLEPIDSAPFYMSNDLFYRLSYADNQIHPYRDSRWTEPAIFLFASVMRQTAGSNLQTMDQFNQLTHCALHIELTDFEQVFTDAHNSHAELGIKFSLIQLRNHLELGRSKLHFEVPAPTADAQGGAQALEKATHLAANKIVEWLNNSLATIPSGTSSAGANCAN